MRPKNTEKKKQTSKQDNMGNFLKDSLEIMTSFGLEKPGKYTEKYSPSSWVYKLHRRLRARNLNLKDM